MAKNAALGHGVEALGDGGRRVEEIAEQQGAGKRDRRAGGGRLDCTAASVSCVASDSAIRDAARRLAIGCVSPIRAMRSPARTSSSAMASVKTTARSRLLSGARWLRKAIEGETSGHSQKVWAASHSRSRT